jgi:hypothetical protein
MKGTRVYTQEDLHNINGSYFFSEETQSWWCRTPNGHAGALGNHEVTENEDGTITVTPSILVTTRINGNDVELYHGYLTNGEWT